MTDSDSQTDKQGDQNLRERERKGGKKETKLTL